MRKWIITGVAAVAVLLLAFIAYGQFTKEDAYRLIKVLSVEGSATVTRESVGELDAYADMQLESGDELYVDGESSVILVLDNDKYVLLEPGTRLTLEAEGTSANSKTVIHLEEGAVVNQLVNKLNDESSYEVTVPNSTMAVRGTVFRVEVVYEDEHSYAYVTVLDGEVASRLIFPDGTVEDESQEWQIPKGSGVNVHGDDEISEGRL
ncbi:MAG: FecR domain-containing protein [Lachnospiraceae bacterium]|nr:FecR domain-containing protein [Lachnospiraceae bacterium]